MDKGLFVPGRLCLFGEHSDWAGGYRRIDESVAPGHCIAIGTDQGIYGTASAHPDKLIITSESMDGETIEIVRVATTGTRNANSKLYGAICRAATALGYGRAVTYTLDSESGVSLRASGFKETGRVSKNESWSRRQTFGDLGHQELLFGDKYPVHDGEKIRWEKQLGISGGADG